MFWCTYKMDRLLSQSLGRPPAIPDGFINVAVSCPSRSCDYLKTPSKSQSRDSRRVQTCKLTPGPSQMPSSLHDVDIHPGQYGTPQGQTCSYKAVFLHTTALRQLQSEILTNTYGIHGLVGPRSEWFEECFERLKVWLATTPEPRGTVSSEGFAISFHSTFFPLSSFQIGLVLDVGRYRC